MSSIFTPPADQTSQPNWHAIIRKRGMDDCSGEYYTNPVSKLGLDSGGEKEKMKMEEFKSASDSISLAKLKNQPFTITAVEDSNYEDGGTVTQGIKLTSKESFTIDGKKWNRFHSTRTAIVNKLRDPKVRERLANGETLGPVKTEEVKAKKGGKPYFDLIDA